MAKKFLDYDGLGYLMTKLKAMFATKADTGHTHPDATTSASGFMSKGDKNKLDGIAAGANAYSHPTTSGNKHIPAGGSSGQILRWSADGTAAWGADNNTTYTHPENHPASMITGLAKVATSGSYNDLTNKPTIPAAVTVDSALSSSSTNPVQNKVVNTALAGKVPTTRKVNDKALSSDITLSASDVKALPAAGGTITGNLKISKSNSPEIEMVVSGNNGYTSMYQHGGTLTISSGMSADADEAFAVMTTPGSDLSNLFRIGTTIGGSTKRYKLYGEHNKPTPADIGLKTESWTFTLEDGSTVTKAVYVG